ncbi:MAG TPA: tRNA uridine-5-carboxymethylaminomethyl(34) synthesis GTPase MnmE [Alphaproteobacteria bacterium]|nr:tRNA uridine-5-carboxymethylaminomethyl(34) synthesis GTPase MnmE [Alphaproteobacteria bacterium]
MAPSRDTIFALSSAPGRAAIAVIRVSGPAAGEALVRLRRGRALPKPRQAAYARLTDPLSGAGLDDGLVLWFPGPASETGEDMAEFQIHGGRATVASVLEALGKLAGLRPAAPGEFTRRAFGNGKLDLTAVEGLADLVNAETEAQRRQALRQLRGELGQLYEGWRARLLRLLAYGEAAIDFPDETAEEGIERDRANDISGLVKEISQHLEDNRRGELLRDGLSLVILGAPNVGKSSLMNALARRDVAIVSERAGTTRDVIEVHLDLAGYPVVIADTAGLRETGDEIELEGVKRARARAEHADVRIVLLDATSWPKIPAHVAPLFGPTSLLVLNKIDRRRPAGRLEVSGHPLHPVSALTGEGMDELVRELERLARERLTLAEAPSLTRLRHRQALESCVEALQRSLSAALPELAVEDLRLALREIGRITGRVDVEDLLDVIFRDFCIGK